MTKFRDGFMMKSPLYKHGDKLREEAKKLSENAEQGDYDYENPKVTQKLEAAKKADKSHESDSPASMSPLNGAYEQGAGGMVYASERDSFQNLFNTITQAANKLVDSKKNKKQAATNKDESLFKPDGTLKETFEEKYNKKNKLQTGKIDTSKYF
ncbi:MAG: hypothetical protein H8E16_12085 [Flavobacteriales bacterium]|nr:hypothetical protein [Flavobacteriales bacterium]